MKSPLPAIERVIRRPQFGKGLLMTSKVGDLKWPENRGWCQKIRLESKFRHAKLHLCIAVAFGAIAKKKLWRTVPRPPSPSTAGVGVSAAFVSRFDGDHFSVVPTFSCPSHSCVWCHRPLHIACEPFACCSLSVLGGVFGGHISNETEQRHHSSHPLGQRQWLWCLRLVSARVVTSSFMLQIKEVKMDWFRRQRPYHAENTSSRPITEVKQHRARLVLGWVTAWEHRVSLSFSLLQWWPLGLFIPSLFMLFATWPVPCTLYRSSIY